MTTTYVSARLRRLRKKLSSQSIDALLIADNPNIHYLTGLPASESWLLVTRKQCFYITDFRYVLEIRQGLKGKPIRLVDHKGKVAEVVFGLAASHKVKTLGFDEQHFTVAEFKALKKKCPRRIKLIAANQLVEDLRMIKDVSEIRLIKKALSIHKEALSYLHRIIRPGVRERDVLLKLEQFVKVRGAGFSFDPIIASGANSCFPHAGVTGRKILRNDIVLIDFGIDWQGYKSDLTRMFALGKIPKFFTEVRSYVAEAQQRAFASIRPGVRACDVDAQARNFLATKKLDKFFGHSLGHGVGIEIHEPPRLGSSCSTVLAEGMVITVEPGVYLPGKFGIRLEEMVLVTTKGKVILSDNID